MSEADKRLARKEKEKQMGLQQRAQGRQEQAEIIQIVKEQREAEDRIHQVKMEERQKVKAEEAYQNKLAQVRRRVIKTVIHSEISTGLVKENKARIEEQKEVKAQATLQRYNSARERSIKNKSMYI